MYKIMEILLISLFKIHSPEAFDVMKCKNNEIRAADLFIVYTAQFKFDGEAATSVHKRTSLSCGIVINQNSCIMRDFPIYWPQPINLCPLYFRVQIQLLLVTL